MTPRLIPALIVTALLAVAVPAFGSSGGGSTTATASDLVYAAIKDGDSEIFRRDASGVVHQLTDDETNETYPRVSPDGKLVAFVSDRGGRNDIYVMGIDGKQVRRVTTFKGDETDPAWSPNGKQIAFAHETSKRAFEIFLINADGSAVQRLTHTKKSVLDIQPSFSPDGKSIVFASNRVGVTNFEIFRLGLDGRVQRLTFNGPGRDGDPGREFMPEYSPDGKRVAYVSDISGRQQVWTLSVADLKDVRRVTRHKGLDVMYPRYSADGKQIAYGSVRLDGRDYIYTAAADGSGAQRVAAGTTPDW